MEPAVCEAASGGFGAASGALGALAFGCLLAGIGFAVKGLRGGRRRWHSRAGLAAFAGLVAVVSAMILLLVGW